MKKQKADLVRVIRDVRLKMAERVNYTNLDPRLAKLFRMSWEAMKLGNVLYAVHRVNTRAGEELLNDYFELLEAERRRVHG